VPADASLPDGAPRPESISGLAWAGIGLAVLVGAVARFLADSPLWLDEALSVNIASLPFGDIAEALRSEAHPPLYYWMLHGWMAAFGEGDVATRALSGVFGLVALPLLFLVGRRLGGARVGAWAVVLGALSPYAVRYSSEARMYSLLAVLVLAGALLVPDALRAPTTGRLLAVAAITGALVLSQYWSIYLVLAVGVVVAVTGSPGSKRVLVAIAGGLLVLVPWSPVILDQLRHTGTPWAEAARPAQVVVAILEDLGTGGVDRFAEGVLLGVVLAVLVSVAGLVDADGTTLAFLAVCAGTVGLGALAGLVTASTFQSRYAAVVVPLLLVLAARGIVALPGRWELVAGAAVVILGLAGVAKVVGTDRTEAGDIAAAVADRAEPGDVLVACPDQLGVALDRALGQEEVAVAVLPYPDLGDPRFVRWRDYEERNDEADPAAVAAEVLDQAPGAVWVAWEGSARTFDGDCEALLAAFTAARGDGEVVYSGGDPRPIEHATLVRFAGA
jgi:mannosyltransferase